MKIVHLIRLIFGIGLLYLAATSTISAQFSLMLPATPPASTPPCSSLPYLAEADHFGGPACVQMVLNTCPTLTSRHCNNQNDIYSSILLYNSEPTTWFSDPNGIKGALSDPALLPCGHWSDFSNTDKAYVLGKMLYWMNSQKYLTPVSIGSGEHWVTVIGYQTDIVPPYTGSVSLLNIFFYDPNPGYSSMIWVSGTAWLTDPNYWGVPLNKPGSAWHNKYIAIIEPPRAKIKIKWNDWIVSGRILDVNVIKEKCNQWLEKNSRIRLDNKMFSILRKGVKIKEPILVNAENFSYYLIPFEDSHLMAIFNAYDGSFEEFRVFDEPRHFAMEENIIRERFSKNIYDYGLEVVKFSKPQLNYNSSISKGRFDPIISATTILKNTNGKEQEVKIELNTAGQIIKGSDMIDKIKIERALIKNPR